MKKAISYMMAGISALILVSRNREVIMPCSYGYLCLNAESDLSTDIIVKSTGEDMVFAVDIKNGAGQTVVHSDDHRTINSENPANSLDFFDIFSGIQLIYVINRVCNN